MKSIKQTLMVSKGHWNEDKKLRWTSSWTNYLPSPSGHIYFFGSGVATPPGELPGEYQVLHSVIKDRIAFSHFAEYLWLLL